MTEPKFQPPAGFSGMTQAKQILVNFHLCRVLDIIAQTNDGEAEVALAEVFEGLFNQVTDFGTFHKVLIESRIAESEARADWKLDIE